MTLALATLANGDTNYIAKHNSNYSSIQAAVNALTASANAATALNIVNLLLAMFGSQTAFLGNTSYTAGTSGTVLNVSGGYAWRPDLGNILSKATPTAVNFSGQAAGTYYISLGGDGTPGLATSATSALYSVVWTGSAFGAITAVAPVMPNGDITGTYQTLTIAAGAVSLAKMAPLAPNSVIANNTGITATPVAIAWGGPNGVASLDSTGKVPASQLPVTPVSLSIVPTWTGFHTFAAGASVTRATAGVPLTLGQMAGATDSKLYGFNVQSNYVQWGTVSDSGAWGTSAVEFDRTGTTITAIYFGTGTDSPRFIFAGDGGITNNGPLTNAGSLITFSGQLADCVSATYYNTVTFPSGSSVYLVSATMDSSGDPTNYFPIGVVSICGNAARYTSLQTSPYLTIAISGRMLQVMQGSGANSTIRWTATRFM